MITSSLHVSALHAITKYEITGTVLVVRMTDNKKNCQTNERSQEICSMFIVNDSDVGYFIIQRSAYIKRKLYSQKKTNNLQYVTHAEWEFISTVKHYQHNLLENFYTTCDSKQSFNCF